MAVLISNPPEQGQMVSVRSRNWMVTDVARSTLPPERLQAGVEPPQHLLTLSSVEDDGLGEELNVIWELRLSPENIRKVVDVGLALADQPPLIPVDDPSGKPVFNLPALKHSWSACAEGLEHPHSKNIRPITFDHAAADGRDDIVLVHLNHRLVQMCLRLLRAEVWSVKGRKRMHRITARLVPNHILNSPVAVAHARLVVIGGDSHRLHEEIITAGGTLKEGRFTRLNLGELEKLMAAATDDEAYEPMQKQLLKLWDKFASPLAQSLEARMKDRTSGLQKKLGERATKEAQDIEAILLELKRAIDTELDEPEDEQLSLFDDLEKNQFERNRDFLRDRSKAIPTEIERETAAIRSRFADPQPRMFPVAVTFLVPERMRGAGSGVRGAGSGERGPGSGVRDPGSEE
jgi:hypothetical protein